MKIADIMSTEVVTVSPGTSLKDVAQLLVDHKISGVPVVDDAGGVLGVVSETDLIVKERGVPRDHGGPLAWLVDPIDLSERVKLEARIAGQAMTSPAVTIAPRRPISAAAERMLERRINRLPVVSDGGRLVGIVTRADLVRAFTRSDAEVAREIRSEVLGDQMLLDEHAVEVEVAAGEVLLTGEIGRRSQAALLPRLAGRVAGVVRVDSRLTWREDDTKR
jgi:CBS domain-containing protein